MKSLGPKAEYCERCGDVLHGHGRNLWMACEENMGKSVVPYRRVTRKHVYYTSSQSRLETQQTYFNLFVCKRCRQEWLTSQEAWFKTTFHPCSPIHGKSPSDGLVDHIIDLQQNLLDSFMKTVTVMETADRVEREAISDLRRGVRAAIGAMEDLLKERAENVGSDGDCGRGSDDLATAGSARGDGATVAGG